MEVGGGGPRPRPINRAVHVTDFGAVGHPTLPGAKLNDNVAPHQNLMQPPINRLSNPTLEDSIDEKKKNKVKTCRATI